jgi:hypothetical protein
LNSFSRDIKYSELALIDIYIERHQNQVLGSKQLPENSISEARNGIANSSNRGHGHAEEARKTLERRKQDIESVLDFMALSIPTVFAGAHKA